MDVSAETLASAISDLTARLGRAPNATEVARAIGTDRHDVVEQLVGGLPFPVVAMASNSDLVTGAPQAVNDLPDIAPLEQELAAMIANEGGTSALDAIPVEERAVLALRLSNTLSQSGIAARLGISPWEVSQMLARSLAVIRDIV